MRTNCSPRNSARKVQPTPQSPQVVITTRSGLPIFLTAFSCKVAVGQARTQREQAMHLLGSKSKSGF